MEYAQVMSYSDSTANYLLYEERSMLAAIPIISEDALIIDTTKHSSNRKTISIC